MLLPRWASNRNHYLNVTPNNLLRIYPPDGAVHASSQHSQPALVRFALFKIFLINIHCSAKFCWCIFCWCVEWKYRNLLDYCIVCPPSLKGGPYLRWNCILMTMRMRSRSRAASQLNLGSQLMGWSSLLHDLTAQRMLNGMQVQWCRETECVGSIKHLCFVCDLLHKSFFFSWIVYISGVQSYPQKAGVWV